MLNNIMIGRYYPIDSKIHKMNPLSKVICVFVFIMSVLINNSLLMTLLQFLLIMYIIVVSRISNKIYFNSIKSMKILLIFVFILNLICKVGIIANIVVVCKILLIVLSTSLLTLTTPPTEITYGLEILFRPLNKLKIPVNRMSLSISLALRFIPTIFDQANKILKSQASRGIDYYNSRFSNKLVAIKSMLIPMFILSIKRADMLAEAMDVRLFSIDQRRTNYRINEWKLFDTVVITITILLFVFIVVKEVFL